jgi:preprotein translocase subunit SecD
MSNLKYRVLLIVALLAASAWSLFPRKVIERVKRGDRYVFDTVTRVPLKRGLDLQGGMHLALEIDESKGTVPDRSEALDRAIKVVRTRIDEFGVAEPVVQKSGDDQIIVELPGIDDPQRAMAVVQKSAFLEFQITDKTQALEKVLPRFDAIVKESGLAGKAAPGDTGRAEKGLQGLLSSGKDSASKDSTAKNDTTKKDSLALTAGGAFSKLIQQGQFPGEYFVAEKDVAALQNYLDLPAIQAALPPGKVLRWGSDTVSLGATPYRAIYMLDSRPIITGESLIGAKPNQVPIEGTVVEFTLSNEGGRKFRAETAKHIRDYMAIVLDQRVMGRPPVIQSAIGTRGQITMGQGRSLQDAQDLALVLRAGALPVPLKVSEVRNIGASLGADSIRAGIRALILAVALVVLILIVYYRFSGVLAVVALALYVVYTMAMLAYFNAVLTLPGLAGFVLSVGIAVDANVLIFERIREELARGKTVRTSIDEGFRHALTAIVDTSVTTILTAAVLYQYGTGPVQGFAVTLIAGITASLFTAIFVVRTFYLLWLSRSRGAQTLSI